MDEPIAEKHKFHQRASAGVLSVARSAWQGIVDVVTPPLCMACQIPVQQGAGLCLACWSKLQMIDEPLCDCLGTPFAYDEGEGALSPAALADPPMWDKGRAAVAFDDASKALVHQLKYQDTFEAGIAMARMMVGAGRKLLADCDVILPVPLHRLRLWQRRFNQAAFLSQLISQQTGIASLTDVLLRQRDTKRQVGLDASQRQKNVRKAFAVALERQQAIEGKTVLLVDDVRTTGATANACAEVLKQAGAARVHVLSFALVLEPARLHIEV